MATRLYMHECVPTRPTHRQQFISVSNHSIPEALRIHLSISGHVGNGLDRLFEIYRDRGVAIVREPKNRFWGHRQFVVQDCDGYIISFVAETAGGV